MKRLVAVLAALLLVSGCSQVLGTTEWTRIEVIYQAGSAKDQNGNYSLVVSPSEAVYTLDGKESSQELPQGAWETLTTGIRALGARESQPCPGGQFLSITAKAGESVKQAYQASSCDAGDALAQAQAAVGRVLELIK